ncbi:hypothetical protein JCM19235_1938 [Vibrio maritimus]|uniref:Uncharacterized protein n=1 Tax=Vibrio maritimus TaxID=990268 RepID=A0A090RT03_9VIBR|nr:hypothetical protein JCM19235_1938 [Vibrio maritimus]
MAFVEKGVIYALAVFGVFMGAEWYSADKDFKDDMRGSVLDISNDTLTIRAKLFCMQLHPVGSGETPEDKEAQDEREKCFAQQKAIYSHRFNGVTNNAT